MAVLDISYVAAAGGGLVSFLSPCVLPLVPAYLCYVTGKSLEELTGEDGAGLSGRQVLGPALAFVFGFSTVFVALGASASAISGLLLTYQDVLARIAGAIIIVFGAHYMGLFRLGFMNRDIRFNPVRSIPGWLGAYVIGIAFALGWTPCVGPILATILAIAGAQDTLADGVVLLAVYSAGLGVPFLLAAAAIPSFMSFSGRLRRHLGKVEVAAGGLLVLTGVLFITGDFQTFSYYLLEVFPFLGEIG
jgi:cytochrome c-type biogenesis protein